MTRLVLVRHGEAVAAVDQVVGGIKGCRGLSALGRRQVHALADRWRAAPEFDRVDALYTSTLPRATETAAILAPALGSPVVRVDREFREWDPGPADGLTWAEHDRRFGSEGANSAFWNRSRAGDVASETWAGFGLRIATALEALVARHQGETVVVACHGGVIEHSFLRFFGRPLTAGPGATVSANASITEWREMPAFEGNPPMWQLVRFGDGIHASGC